MGVHRRALSPRLKGDNTGEIRPSSAVAHAPGQRLTQVRNNQTLNPKRREYEES